MFQNAKAFSGFSVNDLEKARQFYGKVLELPITEDNTMGLLELQIAGGTKILIYPKPNHTPATFTIFNFPVESINEAVLALKNRGVVFESYQDSSYQTDGENISRSPHVDVAWFKDPAGNILSVLQMKEA